MPKIRSPIISILGHVDSGKTTLADFIRETSVAASEPGSITQHIHPYYVPLEKMEKGMGSLLKKMNITLDIPGLLLIDSPGHEAFTTLRKRGGAIADIAVLIVDIFEGFQPQTDESLNFLKQFKTPFVIAITKIDRLPGWIPGNNRDFLSAYNAQPDRVQEDIEGRLYKIVGELSTRGFQADRFDRVDDYTKQIAMVPVSGITGDGVQNLLAVLAGVSQKYLSKGLQVHEGEGKGTVLEVKKLPGLGLTADVILYDGELSIGDLLVIGSAEAKKGAVTKVKALFSIDEKTGKYKKEKNAIAAAFVKVSAPHLSIASAGSPLRAVKKKSDVTKAEKEIEEEVAEVEIKTSGKGAVLKADTLGSLEALTKTLTAQKIPVRRAAVGPVTKSDIMEAKTQKDPILFAFNVPVTTDLQYFAQDNGVQLFSSKIIYTLLKEHQKWTQNKKKYEEEQLLKTIIHPAQLRVLPGFLFRQSKPAVFGIEVMKGILKPNCKLLNEKRKLGELKELQKDGKNVPELLQGDKGAISLPDVTFGKQVKENDVITVFLSQSNREKLEKVRHCLKPDEVELLG